MDFKDLKPGGIFYILTKDTMKLDKATIMTVSAPHIENKINSITQLVVDITMNVDGKPVTYVMQDTGNVSYCAGQILTADKLALIGEIKAIKAQHEQILASVDKSTEIVGKCDSLISELDDAFREKKENDERLSKLENMMKTLIDKLSTVPQPMNHPVQMVMTPTPVQM